MSIRQTKAILYNSKQIIKHFIDWKEIWMKEKLLECSICMETKSRYNFHRTKCNHIFCKICFAKWIDKQPNCPNCRELLFGEDPRSPRSNLQSERTNSEYYLDIIRSLQLQLDIILSQRVRLNGLRLNENISIRTQPNSSEQSTLNRESSVWGSGWTGYESEPDISSIPTRDPPRDSEPESEPILNVDNIPEDIDVSDIIPNELDTIELDTIELDEGEDVD